MDDHDHDVDDENGINNGEKNDLNRQASGEGSVVGVLPQIFNSGVPQNNSKYKGRSGSEVVSISIQSVPSHSPTQSPPSERHGMFHFSSNNAIVAPPSGVKRQSNNRYQTYHD